MTLYRVTFSADHHPHDLPAGSYVEVWAESYTDALAWAVDQFDGLGWEQVYSEQVWPTVASRFPATPAWGTSHAVCGRCNTGDGLLPHRSLSGLWHPSCADEELREAGAADRLLDRDDRRDVA